MRISRAGHPRTRLSRGVRLVAWVMFLLVGRASVAVAADCRDDGPRATSESVVSAARTPAPDLLPASDHSSQEREAGFCLCACECARSQIVTAGAPVVQVVPAPVETRSGPALAQRTPTSFSSPPRLRPPLA